MEFDELKKEFVVNEEEYSKETLVSLMKHLLKYCKVTKTGEVIVFKSVSTRKLLKLIVSARFVAHAADKSISECMTREELKIYSGMKDNVFATRFGEILKERFAEKKEELIRAKNLLVVEKFLENLKNE